MSDKKKLKDSSEFYAPLTEQELKDTEEGLQVIRGFVRDADCHTTLTNALRLIAELRRERALHTHLADHLDQATDIIYSVYEDGSDEVTEILQRYAASIRTARTEGKGDESK